jgi:hypothetical protein
MRMTFDLKKLPSTLAPSAGVNGALYERLYRRYKLKWYLPFCRHGAFKIFAEDTFPVDPSYENGALQTWTLKDCDERLLLVTSKCLVCGKVLLEGRLSKPDGSETPVGVLYVLAKDKFTTAPKDISDEALREFYDREWEFRTSLLADFNKLTIAVAVAAAVFFDKYPSVFYAFVVTCFVMIALYAATYIGQRQITKKYYRDAGKSLTPTYKSSFDLASKYLQVIFGVGIIVVLCLMIRAERMTKQGDGNDLGKTRPYNPPTKVQDTRPYNPPKIEPEKQVLPPPPPPPPEKKK